MTLIQGYFGIIELCRSELYDTFLADIEERCLEEIGILLRHNENHDPHTGRFTSGDSINTVDKSEKSDIIKETSKAPITKITDKAIERVPKVDIDGYTDEQCRFIQQQHKELLKYARDNNENKEAAFVFNNDLSCRKEFLGEAEGLDFGNKLQGKDLFVMHNHPRNSSYSDTDIVFMLSHDVANSLSIVGNDGTVEVISKTDNYRKDNLKLDFKRQYKKYVKTVSDVEIDKAVRKFIERNKEGLQWTQKR